jgi:histidinol-phosphatase (PHP family)
VYLTNFHTHSEFCDGKGELELYVKEAVRLGFQAIGFTSHAPLPFYKSFVMPQERLEEYCGSIRELKIKYADRIQVYLGLEIDYIPGVIGPRSPQFKALDLDYTIGSIHLVKNGKPDGYTYTDETGGEFEELLHEVYDGDSTNFVKHYYSLIREMIQEHRPEVVGHLDIIKKVNKDTRYFDETAPWYREEVYKTLQVVADSKAVLEVNTGGISRGYVKHPHPSPWIFNECHKLGIPIMLNSDAHSPEHLTTYFKEAKSLLREAGYTKQRILFNEEWVDVSLE